MKDIEEALWNFLGFNVNDWMPLKVIQSHLNEYDPILVEQKLDEISKLNYDKYDLGYVYQTSSGMYAYTNYHPSTGCLKYIKREVELQD